MTRDEVVALMKRVTYKPGWRFDLQRNAIDIQFNVPNSRTMEHEWLQLGMVHVCAFVNHTEASFLTWLRDNYPDFEDVMCVLASKGLIDPGKYALHTWW